MAHYRPTSFRFAAYKLGIICALPKELLAIRVLSDETHEGLRTVKEDKMHYSLGRMGKHLVATACLPSGEYGTNSSSAAMQNMRRPFPQLEFCFDQWKQQGREFIDRFFREKKPKALGDVTASLCTEDACYQFAESLLGPDEIFPVNNQGSNSFTLQTSSKIIQFRLKPLNTDTLALANEIYGNLVPKVNLHTWFLLPVYSSDVLLGQVNILVNDSGNVTGVVDFDGAEFEAFGICLWGLYECSFGSMEDGKWAFYKEMPVLANAFWSCLWANLPPILQREEVKTVFKGHGLEKQLALSRLDFDSPKLMEYCEDQMTHVCEITGDNILFEEATEWKFDFENGFVIPVITRGCARTTSNDHKKKDT
ncbi:uncharacterized protein N7483_012444 [Penicillium malachiteum]|uniref:uncharacterized protein n=1 Tax=Penicillium malachiteum TaxID=1324776 RepID=UPI00254749D5|nr:uncharacterized protein N7483_012444 [Penicillium malachiteum]KAJ5715263.1 hypothetical protein N7483_012444 [Penicillium malachiteum]